MRRLSALKGALVVAALLATQGGLRGGDVDRERVLEITGNIVCNCGCPPTLVRACSCHRAEEITKEVEGLLAAGKTNDEVYQYYVGQFGAKMLAAPKAEGFNLLGWVFPFVALALGGAAVALVYRRLRVAAPAAAAPGEPSAANDGSRAKDDKYRKLIKDALSED